MNYYETKKNIALANFKALVRELEETHKRMERALEEGGLTLMLEEAKDGLDGIYHKIEEKLEALEQIDILTGRHLYVTAE